MTARNVSHYLLLDKIGSGGMGEVYLAEDTKLDRKVALKFLPVPMTEDREARSRFEREAKAAAALNHPNIVTVYEIGEHEGQVFIAMEYVEGQTLKELISANRPPSAVGRLPISQVLDIALQITSGLAAAHAKGIIHRDIKPQNILLDKSGRVKILDFGLAKLKGASPLTRESITMGTVHYMSPEQGLGREVDPRSDIWSLGVVLYQLASGELPFDGEYDQAVIYAILNESPPPLAIGTIPAGAGLETVIRRCLAKKRHDRYPSAEAMAAALRDLNEAGEAPRPDKSSCRRPFRRAVLALLALGALAAGAGVILTPWAGAPLRRLLGVAVIPRARHMAVLPIVARGDAEFMALGHGFTAVITDKLTWLEKFHDSMWTVPAGEVFANRGKPGPTLQRLWGCNLFIVGELGAERTQLRLRLALQDAGSGRTLKRVEIQGNMANLSLFQDELAGRLMELLELREEPEATRYVNTGGTSMPGAYILFLKGKALILDKENSASSERGIHLLERALQQDDHYLQARLALVEALGAASGQIKNQSLPLPADEQGRLLRQAAGQWAPAMMAWASLLDRSGKKAEALLAWRQALRLNGRCYQACIKLANACRDESRTGEAEKYYKQAIQLRPGYPPALENLAFFYNLNGRYDEARDLYERVTELAPGEINGYVNLGAMYMNGGDPQNAIIVYEKANAIQPDPAIQSNLATLYFFKGAYRKALPLYHTLARETNDHVMWGNLADTYRQLPEYQGKAGAAYRQAIALAEALLVNEVDSQKISEITSCLAMYCAHSGEKAKALAAIARARSLAPSSLEIIRRAVLVHEAVGERSQALAALSEYRERLGGMEEIEREPDLAALCRDPAYVEIRGNRQ